MKITNPNLNLTFICPKCGGTHFGASHLRPGSKDMIYKCHGDEDRHGCGWVGAKEECMHPKENNDG